MEFYPNPFTTSATLETNGYDGVEEMSFAIYDVYGREVMRGIIPIALISPGINFVRNLTISRGDLPSGVYLLIATDGIQTSKIKLAIQ